MLPRIAVIGSNGFLGKPVLAALTSDTFSKKISLPIIATTRSVKDKASSNKLKYVEADLSESNLDNLYDIFKGIDVIVELTSPNQKVFSVIEKIVAHVEPKLFIPSQFGNDLEFTDKYLPGFSSLKTEHSANARKAGVKTVDIIAGFFVIAGQVVGHLGIDTEANTVTFRGDPDLKLAISKLEDVGNTIASLSTSSSYSNIPDKVRIYSFLASNRDIAKEYESFNNVQLKELPPISKAESLKEGQERFAKGYKPSDFFYYLGIIASQGVDQGLAFSSNERELVNPKESVWKWGKL